MALPDTLSGSAVIAVQNANQVPLPPPGREYLFRDASDLSVYAKLSTGAILPLGGGGGTTTTKVTPTALAIDNSNLTPVQILPAPGAGKAIQVISIAWNFAAGATNYNHNFADIYSNPAPGEIQTQILGGNFNQVSPFISFSSINGNIGARNGLLANAPLFLRGDGPPNGGDGVLDLYISYIILTL